MKGAGPFESTGQEALGVARTVALPDRDAFAPTDVAYLDSGSQHPISLGARAAVEAYLGMRTLDPVAQDFDLDPDGLVRKFARLVNADPDELTFVQSTTAGEQMVLRALGMPESGGHIVTDTLHFFGSIPMYEELARQGMEVSWVRARDGRVDLEDVRRAVRADTRLVALSLVSTFNGFEQDLKAVCDIAHEAGALVYADIIHAAGCVPVDLHGSGVDFAATSSFKWLMGDFGLGFLYVRRSSQHHLRRSHYGYFGIGPFQTHIYPLDPPGDSMADYAYLENAQGVFALGTHAHTVVAQLHHSLDYIERVGVSNIQAHAQSLVRTLKMELPRLGYPLLTPPESKTPMVTCQLADAARVLGPRLRAAQVQISTARNRFRVSVSVFNDMSDVDRLLAALDRS